MTCKLKKLRNYSLKYRFINFLANRKLLNAFNFILILKNRKVIRKIPIMKGMGKDLLIESEPWMSNLLYSLRDKLVNKSFVDVGVNVGQTLIKIKEVVPTVEYVGFEPNPYCVNYLLNLIELNNLKNTTIIPAALSNELNHLKLLLDSQSPSDTSASFIKNYRKGNFHQIDIITVKPSDLSIFQKIGIGVIKIDVEGAELEVLDGLKGLILRNKPHIIIEVLPVYKKKTSSALIAKKRLKILLKI